MLTSRDREVLTWIEKYKSITVSQCTYLFFGGNYEVCRRRLKKLEEMNFLKSSPSVLLKSKIYFNEKQLSEHDLFIIEFLKAIKVNGGEIVQFEIKPHYMDNSIIPDAYIVFSYNGNVYFTLLEVDLTHYTSHSKMKKYEELFKTGELQSKCFENFPIIVVGRPTEGIRYNSNNFSVIYLDLFYNNLNNLLLHNSSIL